MRPLVIYHHPCADGFTAAWVAARALTGEVELYPGEYGKAPPYELAQGRPVWIVDFSYPRPELEKLAAAADSLCVLDHHKTAQAALEGLPYCTFDMHRSGAGLAWDHFHPGEPRPWVVDVVEDRDLWRFALPHSEALSLLVRATPHELGAWDELAALEPEAALSLATGCARYLRHYVEDAVRNAFPIHVLWSDPGEPDDFYAQRSEAAYAVNVTYTGVSDVLHQVLERHPVRLAIGWQLQPDGRLNVSLRSSPDFDCSEIARVFGGGGHAQAAGCRLAVDHPLARRLMRTDDFVMCPVSRLTQP